MTPHTINDESFFQQLYAEYYQQRFSFLPNDQLKSIVELQYLAKIASYNKQWPKAIAYLVQLDHIAIGKIILNENASSMHIVDVLVSEKYRNQGLGRKLLHSVEQKALDVGCPKVTLSVAINNKAKHLYDNLGYEVISQDDNHFAMQKLLRGS